MSIQWISFLKNAENPVFFNKRELLRIFISTSINHECIMYNISKNIFTNNHCFDITLKCRELTLN